MPDSSRCTRQWVAGSCTGCDPSWQPLWSSLSIAAVDYISTAALTGQAMQGSRIMSKMCEARPTRLLLMTCYLQLTVSTVGLIPQLRELCSKSGAQVAVSIHTPSNEVRDWLVPANRR